MAKGQGDLYLDKTAIYKHREWRGLADTCYDFKAWCGLWGKLLVWAMGHPVQNVKAILRYRWMFTYLTVPSFFARIMSGLKGAALKAAWGNMTNLVVLVTELLDTVLSADEHLHPNSKKAKELSEKIILMDELIPAIICKGFPDYKVVLAQMLPAYLPSLINQHSPVHYISQTESYGLPADVCPLPSLEAGVAIEDDFPKEGKCIVTCNMPCDGSIMTSALQDRRFKLPSHALNIPLRWKRKEAMEYSVAEYRDLIKFLEEQTGQKFNWDSFREACEIWNQQTLCKQEKWEMNRTEFSPHTGSTAWLYRIFEYQCACGDKRSMENDLKVNEYLRKQVAAKKFPKTVRHRAVIWNTPANMYANFNNWLLDCWGIDSVAEMIDFQGSELIDTTNEETMLCGIARMAQGATMRVHTKGGYEVILNDLWEKVEEFNADMVVMFDQISCKGVGAINGLFEEGARKRGIPMVWVKQDLMDPTTFSRRDLRSDINTFMETVMNEEPLDPTLVDFDDSESW